jgi:hypothetical protein
MPKPQKGSFGKARDLRMPKRALGKDSSFEFPETHDFDKSSPPQANHGKSDISLFSFRAVRRMRGNST